MKLVDGRFPGACSYFIAPLFSVRESLLDGLIASIASD